MQTKIVKTPCETCANKNSVRCFSALAMSKTACSMEMEMFNHGVENLISEIVIPCKNYVCNNKLLKQQYKKIV
ncbi:hypothetical protein SAMN05660706_11913 [Desulfoscipio geothermicus DSM 3669]|jgi:hypothetical protein|uniref:Uncharacterized protein n=1 Tax=Desulfoscipio geothermicus DSM 3669 TaxID=1121426 RepID=A0A1I6DWA5_9FIRM|nr:hypothetical protein SAMN05660706_11913 [Desulfoscipio geothermicus DSM 3669]